MYTYDHIMVRFGELSTKGKNKKDFIKQLGINIKHALKFEPRLAFLVMHDHIYVGLNGVDPNPILERLQDVSGIQSLSLVCKTEAEMENLKKVSLELIRQESGHTFKVKARRTDKSFPYVSDTINREVAGAILHNTDWKVNVHEPDILLSIEIRLEAAYIFTKTVPGAGGYPLGVGGKVMTMVSGGIDSPVAAYLLMRRGITVQAIHFASPPYTQEAVIEKIKDLLHVLNRYQPKIRLYVIPFTKLQEAIYKYSDESYAITIMRRMMYRISEKMARRHRCLALANGESVGQVASQTLNSMAVINEVVSLPVIRPLATTDKIEIIKLARKIKTYDISIRPFEDCCTIFTPVNPKTMPKLSEVLAIEAKFDYASLVEECVAEAESYFLTSDDLKEEFF